MKKIPIGIQAFSKLIEGGFVYLDKTDMIYRIANTPACYFLSRPRRFGKSLTLSTLHEYFDGQKELFEGEPFQRCQQPDRHITRTGFFNTLRNHRAGNPRAAGRLCSTDG